MERYSKIIGLVLLLFPLCLFSQAGPYAHSTPQGNTYYLSPTGSDSNAGTQAAPWLSPDHSLNCGDIIIASASTSYSATNFASGKWGNVTCASGNNVATLMCVTFDACKITAGSTYGMYVSSSYWAVLNWEVTVPATGFTCFAAAPPSSGATAGIHHIIFANDIANGCGGGGITSFSVSNFGVDYIFVIGDIAYNAAQNSLNCYTGISIFQPVASDSNAGTHIYVAGNISYGNIDPSNCPNPPGGTNTATDGGGAIFDTFDWKNVGAGPYTQKAVMNNNIFVGNGGYGMQIQSYTKNLVSNPTFIRTNNTIWGNNTSSTQATTTLCGESLVNLAYNVQDTANLIQSTRTTACPTSNTLYAAYKYDTTNASGSSDSGNWYFAASGSGTTQGSFNDDSGTFTYGSNIVGTNPAFTAPAIPGAPSCGSFSSVPNCMSTVISNFTPTAVGASSYGYQPVVLNVNGSDTNYPHVLCITGLPSGLTKPSC